MATHHLDLLLYYIPTTLHVYQVYLCLPHNPLHALCSEDRTPDLPHVHTHTLVFTHHFIRYIESAWVQK